MFSFAVAFSINTHKLLDLSGVCDMLVANLVAFFLFSLRYRMNSGFTVRCVLYEKKNSAVLCTQ